MIARLEVTRGTLTEYPLAERTKNGWQNGVTFYPDADVTKVTLLVVQAASEPQGEPSNHYDSCEADWGPEGQESPCRCAERAQGEPSEHRDRIALAEFIDKALDGDAGVGVGEFLAGAILSFLSERAALQAVFEPQSEPSDAQVSALCGDWPAPCNCDDPDTHDGEVPAWLVRQEERGEPSAAALLAQGFTEGVNFIDEQPGPWGAGMVAGRAEAARRRAASDVTEQGEKGHGA